MEGAFEGMKAMFDFYGPPPGMEGGYEGMMGMFGPPSGEGSAEEEGLEVEGATEEGPTEETQADQDSEVSEDTAEEQGDTE